jgi:hypothetical protein
VLAEMLTKAQLGRIEAALAGLEAPASVTPLAA